MPVYAFQCYDGCGHYFEITCSMNEIENKKPNCPECDKNKTVFRNFDGDVYICNSTPTTVGALAERNGERMSADEINSIQTKNRIGKPKFTGSLPEGGRLKAVDSKGKKIASTDKKGKNFGRI